MPRKLDKAAAIVGEAVGTVESATAIAADHVWAGLSEARKAIRGSPTSDRVEKATAPAKKAATKKASAADAASAPDVERHWSANGSRPSTPVIARTEPAAPTAAG